MSNIFTQIKPHFLSSSSTALTGGKLFIYTAGTTTKASLFSDKLLSSAIANPVILNSRGEPTSDGSTACSVWIADGVYKYVIAPATDTDPPTSPIDTVDNIPLSSSTFYDSNGNVVLSLITAAAAVNYVTITDASTDNSPIIATAGNDTNIGVKLQGKGTGAVILGQSTSTGVQLAGDQPLQDSSGNNYLTFAKTASAVNSLKVKNAATGNPITIQSSGETNKGLILADSNSNALLTGTSVASAVNSIGISNTATGNNPIIQAVGEVNKGIIIKDSNSNAVLTLGSTASAVNSITVTNTATGSNPVIQATGEANKGVIIKDSNGTAALTINSVASSVNGLKITETATGSAPILSVTGDVNRGLIIADSNNAAAITVASTASAVNAITVTNQITTVAPVVQATGSDSNISLSLKGSGTSGVTAGTPTGTIPMIWQPGSTVNTISHSVPTITAARTVTWPDASMDLRSFSFSTYASANQSISASVNTKIQFNTKNFDRQNCFDNVTNFRFTATVAGDYMITAKVGRHATSNAGVISILMIYKNGSEISETSVLQGSSSSQAGSCVFTSLIPLAVNDYLEVFYSQNDAGAQTITLGSTCSEFSGFKLPSQS